MISLDYAARQMGGAWKMAADAADWRQSLDRTVEDVFRSGGALLFSAPLVALFTISARQAALRIPDFSDLVYVTSPLAALLAADLAVFILDWAASLAILLMLARAAGAGGRASELVVGFNWIQPVIAAIQLPAIALTASTASLAVGRVVAIPAFVVILFLVWGVVRRGLGVRRGPAAAIVVMLTLIGAVIDGAGSTLLKSFFAA